MKDNCLKIKVLCRNGFTLVELLIVVSIIVILMALLLPALRSAKAQTHKIACSGNLKQFGIANISYAQDNNDWPPISYTDGQLWDYQLMPYINYPQNIAEADSKSGYSIFHCPGATPSPVYKGYRSLGYSYNRFLSCGNSSYVSYWSRFSRLETPGCMLLMTDFGQFSPEVEHVTFMNINNRLWVGPVTSQFVKYISYRHLGRTNVLFADGHAASCAKGIYDNTNEGWTPQGTKWYNGGTVY